MKFRHSAKISFWLNLAVKRLKGGLKFYIHKIWKDVKKVVTGGFRPPVYLTFCIYLIQRFYFYEGNVRNILTQYLWQPCSNLLGYGKNGNRRLRRTWFGYNNSEMLHVKCCICFLFLISGSIGYNQRNR